MSGPFTSPNLLTAIRIAFIPAIVGFIEGIILLTTSPDRFATKYGAAKLFVPSTRNK